MKVHQMTITKEIASLWLGKNTQNRPLAERTVLDYARQMDEGLWLKTGDPIRFSGDFERLIDGQHRLTAFVKSKLSTMEFTVMSELSENVFMALDLGKKRGPGDIIGMAGYADATTMSSIVKGIIYMKQQLVTFQTGGLLLGMAGRQRVTPQEMIEFIEKNPSIINITRQAGKWYALFRGVTKSEFGIYYFMFAEKNERMAFNFMEQLSSGLHLTQDDPIHMLRKRLEHDKSSSTKMVGKMRQAMIIYCWNAYRRGVKVKQIRIDYQADLPEIL